MDFSGESPIFVIYWYIGLLVRSAGPVGPLRPVVSVVWLVSTSSREICYFLSNKSTNQMQQFIQFIT